MTFFINALKMKILKIMRSFMLGLFVEFGDTPVEYILIVINMYPLKNVMIV